MYRSLIFCRAGCATLIDCSSAYRDSEFVFQVTCDGSYCSTSCPPGYVQLAGLNCALFEEQNSPAPICTIDKTQFKLDCFASVISVDSSLFCSVTSVLPFDGISIVEGVSSGSASIVSSSDEVIIVDSVTGTNGMVTIDSGIGSFTVTSLVSIDSFTLYVDELTVQSATVAASAPPLVRQFTPGALTEVSLAYLKPTTFVAGTPVTLTYHVLDQYGNIVLAANGQLASLDTIPARNIQWSPASALTFSSGVARTTITDTAANKLSVSLIPGADLYPDLVYQAPIVMTLLPGSPSAVRLQINDTTLTVGKAVLATLVLLDAFGNVGSNLTDWNMSLTMTDGVTAQTMPGRFANGTFIFAIGWMSPGSLQVTVNDVDGKGITIPPVMLLVVAPLPVDTTTTVILYVSVACTLVAALIFSILWRKYKLITRRVDEKRYESLFAMSTILNDMVTEKVSKGSTSAYQQTLFNLKTVSGKVNETLNFVLLFWSWQYDELKLAANPAQSKDKQAEMDEYSSRLLVICDRRLEEVIEEIRSVEMQVQENRMNPIDAAIQRKQLDATRSSLKASKRLIPVEIKLDDFISRVNEQEIKFDIDTSDMQAHLVTLIIVSKLQTELDQLINSIDG